MRTDLQGKVTHSFTSTPSSTIHAIHAGRGEPLVLLHSLGCSALEYSDVIDSLASNFQVVAWDMVGHGDSDPALRHHSVGAHADILIAWIEALGLGRCHLGGASIGGLIALEAAVRRPDLFRSVALIEAGLMSATEWQARWPVVEQTFGFPQQSLEAVRPRFSMVDEILLHRWNVDRLIAGSATMIAGMWALRRYDYVAALGNLDLPTLLLYGSDSPVFESVARAKAILAEHATTVIMEDCGHFPMVDDPGGFASALIEFASAVDAEHRS